MKKGCKKYPEFAPPKTIAVDLDGTLVSNGIHGEINSELVATLRQRKANGFTLILWSMRGPKACHDVVDHWGLNDLFDHILSKPGYIVDDKGWNWIQRTRVLGVDGKLMGEIELMCIKNNS